MTLSFKTSRSPGNNLFRISGYVEFMHLKPRASKDDVGSKSFQHQQRDGSMVSAAKVKSQRRGAVSNGSFSQGLTYDRVDVLGLLTRKLWEVEATENFHGYDLISPVC